MSNIQRIKLALMKFSQAWVACLIAMAGGVSLYHMTVAAKTGCVSSVGVLATSYLPDAYRTPMFNIVLGLSGHYIHWRYYRSSNSLWSSVDGSSSNWFVGIIVCFPLL